MSFSLSIGITGWEHREKEVSEKTAAPGRQQALKPWAQSDKMLFSGCMLHHLSCGTDAPSSPAQTRGFAIQFHLSCRRNSNTNRWKSPFPSSHVQTMYHPSSFAAPTSNLSSFANMFPLKLQLVLVRQLSRPGIQITTSHRLKFT